MSRRKRSPRSDWPSWSEQLLIYAEALRTGHDLRKAARYQRDLRQRFPVIVKALEAEMPHAIEAPWQKQRPAKAEARPSGRGLPPTGQQLYQLKSLAERVSAPYKKPATRDVAAAEIERLRELVAA